MLATYFPPPRKGDTVKYGNDVSAKHCQRCKKPIGNRNLHYQDGLWWHKLCHDQAMAEFAEATEKARVALAEARAEEQAGRFGFTVSAKNFTKPFSWKMGLLT